MTAYYKAGGSQDDQKPGRWLSISMWMIRSKYVGGNWLQFSLFGIFQRWMPRQIYPFGEDSLPLSGGLYVDADWFWTVLGLTVLHQGYYEIKMGCYGNRNVLLTQQGWYHNSDAMLSPKCNGESKNVSHELINSTFSATAGTWKHKLCEAF